VWRSQSEGPINASGSGYKAYALFSVQRRSEQSVAEHTMQAHPITVQLGVRLTRSAPLAVEKLVHFERGMAFQHTIDCAGQFMGQDGQGFALTVFFLQAGEIFLPGRIVS
jgi:hypothetical protein